MSDRASRRTALDAVISYLSPTAGLKRVQAKAALDAFRYRESSSLGYTGAKTRHGLAHSLSVVSFA